MVVILMGPTGCGKTTVGRLLAHRLGWPFLDGDDFHPEANRAKMRRGCPLDDADRRPWLLILKEKIDAWLAAGQSGVLACSALKQAYRDILGVDQRAVRTVLLIGRRALLQQRLVTRRGHFMDPNLLESQLATLEPPPDGLTVDITPEPAVIVAEIVTAIDQ